MSAAPADASARYRTAARPARIELREKGSRFIAEVFVVRSEEEAEREIETVRQREHGATHHCTAYRVGVSGDVYRYDDDGEPSGTAGPPILRQIEGRDLTNTLVVVTRYYGGTKLGRGGLVRAYGSAAADALDEAGEVEHVVTTDFLLAFGYEDTSPAMQVVNEYDAEVVASSYTDTTRIRVAVSLAAADRFAQAFVDALGGRGQIERPAAGGST